MDVPEKYNLPVLIFDSECSLCKRFSDSLKHFKGLEHINHIDAYQEELYSHFSFLTKESCLSEVHYITETQEVLTGSAVVEKLLLLNPMIKKISWLIDSNAGQKAIDIFYKSANIYRESLLNRCPKCKTR